VNNNPVHILYITIACLIWIGSFFGEIMSLQPFSMIGMVISPIISLYGVFLWLRYYKKAKGYYPNIFRTIRPKKINPITGLDFVFSNVLELWTLIIHFWMLMVLFAFLTFVQSKAFKTTKEYCKTQSEIKEKTGKIKYFGILIGGTIKTYGNDGEADMHFTIIGEKGNFKAKSVLYRDDNEWEVIKVEIKE